MPAILPTNEVLTMSSAKEMVLIILVCLGAGLAVGTVLGYLLGMIRGQDQERRRCLDIVSGRLCDRHYPKREFRDRLNEPCDWCDRVAECIDYIELGLPQKVKTAGETRQSAQR
jgi:hypothetical protein